MLRTIILDAYRENEKKEISDALNMICNPNDTYGWASAGIYAYWDYESKEILYVGLAVDLNERFKQHNGFYSGVDPKTCKKDQIDAYFSSHEKLGFSIVVQSPLSQPSIKKVQNQFADLFEKDSGAAEQGKDGIDEIQRLEGILIESYRKLNKNFPTWNKMSGSLRGQCAVRPANQTALRVLANHQTHYLTARSTLREIAANSTLERYENYLHAARMLVPFIGAHKAFDLLDGQDPIGTYQHIMAEGYLEKTLAL